ncbi:MAG: hypothetical protein U5J83_03990 [Bryobacterales bacterium]|nr:hypothetical protein [Bryobacterales bacterium]
MSGLGPYFDEVVVAEEKSRNAYREPPRQSVARTVASSWMIGTSSKSDINPGPGDRDGMRFTVPHARNWHLEEEDLVPGDGTLLQLERFADLREHF